VTSKNCDEALLQQRVRLSDQLGSITEAKAIMLSAQPIDAPNPINNFICTITTTPSRLWTTVSEHYPKLKIEIF
jgi:hypothetical protein